MKKWREGEGENGKEMEGGKGEREILGKTPTLWQLHWWWTVKIYICVCANWHCLVWYSQPLRHSLSSDNFTHNVNRFHSPVGKYCPTMCVCVCVCECVSVWCSCGSGSGWVWILNYVVCSYVLFWPNFPSPIHTHSTYIPAGTVW